MRLSLLALALLLTGPHAVADEAADLAQLIEDVRAADLARDPFLAERYGDKEAAARLPVASLDEINRQKKEDRLFLRRLDAINEGELSENDAFNRDLQRFVIAARVERAAFDDERIPFSNDSGFHTILLDASDQVRIGSKADAQAWLSRLVAAPRYFNEQTDNMRRGIDTGFTQPRIVVERAIEITRNQIVDDVTASPLYAPFAELPDDWDEDLRIELQEHAASIIADQVMPALQMLLAFLKNDYLPAARPGLGISTAQGGRAYYESEVRYYTTTSLTPDEIHQIGLNEVARIRAGMEAIITEVEFDGSFAEFLHYLRTEPRFYAASAEQLLKEAAWIAKRVDGLMPEYFETLPRLSYGVRPVPDALAPAYTTGRYWPGNPQRGIAGNYIVNTYDLPARPLYELPSLTVHEGVPGHHHQFSLAQEIDDAPAFRKDLYLSAYGEGWGLYTEKLAVEMGVYQTPYEHFGRLSYEMWRACRLVVDTGIHWKGYTREQAEQCFLDNSALSHGNIITEVDRYIAWPAQALSYKVGELKLWELRRRAERVLGDNFDLRAFHDAVLLDGAMPLTMLEAKIDRWIADQQH